jgi:hypothetical protein
LHSVTDLTCAIFLANIRRIFRRLNVIPIPIPTRCFLYIHCASSSRFPAVLSQTSFIHLHCDFLSTPPPSGAHSWTTCWQLFCGRACTYSLLFITLKFSLSMSRRHIGELEILLHLFVTSVLDGVSGQLHVFFLFTCRESILVLFE